MLPHRLNRIKHIHFIGIGGAGMSGIASVLLGQGYQVTGSDLCKNAMVAHLCAQGARIFSTHHADHVEGADVVVVSSAIAQDNTECIAAKKASIPVLSRAQILADLMRTHCGIAISGTHGKTTTTSLVASILMQAGLDPTFVIGGLLKHTGTHAGLGKSPFFVAEADESDASFLHMAPEIAVVTNIDADHMATYQHDFGALKRAFVQFLHHLPFYGLGIVCLDDAGVAAILPQVARRVWTYGFHQNADVQICHFRAKGHISHFDIKNRKTQQTAHITLNLAGKHNALNATAACAVAMSLKVAIWHIEKALAQFAGTSRRMQVYGEYQVGKKRVLLMDDYGHHPREIAATRAALAESFPHRRHVLIYQPHRYSRTKDLFDDFVQVLSSVDQLILLDIYPGGEKPRPDIHSKMLFDAIQKARPKSCAPPVFIPDIRQVAACLPALLQDQDIVLTQGAGDISTLAAALAQTFSPVFPAK